MSYIWMVVIGLIVGVIAKMLHPGKENMGMIMTILLGIAGSVVMTMAGKLVGWYKDGETAGFIASVIGALLILIIYGLVAKKRVNADTPPQ